MDLAEELTNIIKLNLELYQNRLNNLHSGPKNHKLQKKLRKYCLQFNKLGREFRPVSENGLEGYTVSDRVLQEYKILYQKLLTIT